MTAEIIVTALLQMLISSFVWIYKSYRLKVEIDKDPQYSDDSPYSIIMWLEMLSILGCLIGFVLYPLCTILYLVFLPMKWIFNKSNNLGENIAIKEISKNKKLSKINELTKEINLLKIKLADNYCKGFNIDKIIMQIEELETKLKDLKK